MSLITLFHISSYKNDKGPPDNISLHIDESHLSLLSATSIGEYIQFEDYIANQHSIFSIYISQTALEQCSRLFISALIYGWARKVASKSGRVCYTENHQSTDKLFYFDHQVITVAQKYSVKIPVNILITILSSFSTIINEKTIDNSLYTQDERFAIAKAIAQRQKYIDYSILKSLDLSCDDEFALLKDFDFYGLIFKLEQEPEYLNKFTFTQVHEIALGIKYPYKFSFDYLESREYPIEMLRSLTEKLFITLQGDVPLEIFDSLPLHSRVLLIKTLLKENSYVSSLSLRGPFKGDKEEWLKYGSFSKIKFIPASNNEEYDDMVILYNHKVIDKNLYRIQSLAKLQQLAFLGPLIDSIKNMYFALNSDGLEKKSSVFSWIYYLCLLACEHISLKSSTLIHELTIIELLYCPSESLRFFLTDEYFELIADGMKYNRFIEIINTKPRRAILPTILLVQLCPQESFTKHIDICTKNIGRAYKDSIKMEKLLTALRALKENSNIDQKQKISVIFEILHPRTLFIEAESLIQSTNQIPRTRRTLVGFSDFILVKSSNTDFILSGRKQNGSVFVANVAKTSSLLGLNNLLQKFQKNGRNIASPILQNEILHQIESSKYIPIKIQSELESWVALSILSRLNMLCDLNSKSLVEAIVDTFKKVFDLTGEHGLDQVYTLKPEKLLHLLTYYTGLSHLKMDAEIYLELMKKYVSLVISQNSREFYKFRYDEKINIHLREVFVNSSVLHMRELWLQGDSITFNRVKLLFPHIFAISSSALIETDIKIIIRKSILSGSLTLEQKGYTLEKAKRYLASDSPKKRAYIKKQLRNEIKRCNSESLYTSYLKLQLLIISLYDSAGLSTSHKLILVNKISSKLYDLKSYNSQFKHEIERIEERLENELSYPFKIDSKQDLSKYILIDTDGPDDLFMSGTNVSTSCLSIYGCPEYNKSLIGGFVLSGHIRMLAVVDRDRNIIARSMLRLAQDTVSLKPVLMIEPIYPKYSAPTIKRALQAFAVLRARKLGCTLLGEPLDLLDIPEYYPNTLRVQFGYGEEMLDCTHSRMKFPYTIYDKSPILFDYCKYKSLLNYMNTIFYRFYGPSHILGLTALERIYRKIYFFHSYQINLRNSNNIQQLKYTNNCSNNVQEEITRRFYLDLSNTTLIISPEFFIIINSCISYLSINSKLFSWHLSAHNLQLQSHLPYLTWKLKFFLSHLQTILRTSYALQDHGFKIPSQPHAIFAISPTYLNYMSHLQTMRTSIPTRWHESTIDLQIQKKTEPLHNVWKIMFLLSKINMILNHINSAEIETPTNHHRLIDETTNRNRAPIQWLQHARNSLQSKKLVSGDEKQKINFKQKCCSIS